MTERVWHSEHPSCKCRRCRLVRFAEQVESLLRYENWPTKANLTIDEYHAVFTSKVKELHQQTVLQ